LTGATLWGWLFSLLLAVAKAYLAADRERKKRMTATCFVSAALQLSDAVISRHIVNESQFKEGLSSVIDGVVLCLNASTWSKPVQP
jgi:hypothetical protein